VRALATGIVVLCLSAGAVAQRRPNPGSTHTGGRVHQQAQPKLSPEDKRLIKEVAAAEKVNAGDLERMTRKTGSVEEGLAAVKPGVDKTEATERVERVRQTRRKQ
jgi:hypothetical protein